MSQSQSQHKIRIAAAAAALIAAPSAPSLAAGAQAQEPLIIGGEGANCIEDPHCINRLHPDIPMTSRAAEGQTIVFRARNAYDEDLDPNTEYVDPRGPGVQFGAVHPLTGPVHIEGARAGDAIAVTLLEIDPGDWAWTRLSSIGVVSDQFEGADDMAVWRLGEDYATSDDLPGVRIPNASFPGVVTTLPGREQLADMLSREAALLDAGGFVFPPDGSFAAPENVCGEGGSHADECLRTIPPREHGGNMDIRYLSSGVTIYLPCYVDGCGLAIGDLHYAQGDGEVSGTAIEMDADVTLTTRIVRGGAARLKAGPHYEGPSRLLNIPSERFYATTGFPLKRAGEVPPRLGYLDSPKAAALENLSMDIDLAARNALMEMINYISSEYGYTREQAYLIASVAVDLRIGQLVDAPNVGVTAILPLDIFVDE